MPQISSGIFRKGLFLFRRRKESVWKGGGMGLQVHRAETIAEKQEYRKVVGFSDSLNYLNRIGNFLNPVLF